MPTTPGVRCPMCGHVTPNPRGREFITCTCGLRLVNQHSAAAGGRARAHTLFAFLAVACIVTAAIDLVRRMH